MAVWPSSTIPLYGVDITGGIGGTSQNPSGITGKNLRYVQKLQVNLATIGTSSAYNTQYPTGFTYASGDNLYLTPLPALTQMDFTQVYNVTALGANTAGGGSGAPTSFSFGDNSSSTRYVSGYSTTTAGSVWTQALTVNPLFLYTSAAKLYLTFSGNTAPYSGIVQVIIGYTDVTADAPTTNQ